MFAMFWDTPPAGKKASGISLVFVYIEIVTFTLAFFLQGTLDTEPEFAFDELKLRTL